MPFKALGLGPKILKAIQDVGYSEPTPIQLRAVPVVLKGRDLIGIAQTGTGKTAAYVWPVLERLMTTPPPVKSDKPIPRVLILTPTRELAVQVFENLKSYARHLPLRFAAVYGGVSDTPQIRAMREGVDGIVATPGRLLDLMSTLQAPVRDVEVLILDEADRMLDMGFIPDIRRIVRALPFNRQTLLFSATFSSEIEKISREFLQTPETVEIGRRATPTEQVAQFVFEVPKHLKSRLLVNLLQDEGLDSVLVFCRTKHGADKLSRYLSDEGVATAALHSNRSQSQRMAALKAFKAGQVRVLVATDIAARGIDVDGISHVVNFDFPSHSEDYVHRIGRTGRAQAIGDALSFVTPDDQGPLKALERFIGRGIPRRKAADFDYTARPTERPLLRRGEHGSERRGGSGPAERRGGRSSDRFPRRPGHPGITAGAPVSAPAGRRGSSTGNGRGPAERPTPSPRGREPGTQRTPSARAPQPSPERRPEMSGGIPETESSVFGRPTKAGRSRRGRH